MATGLKLFQIYENGNSTLEYNMEARGIFGPRIIREENKTKGRGF
jgi:hypothetical protein